MQKHPMNIEESQRIKKEMGELIQPKMCYNNTFQVMTYNHQKFFDEEWKIAYGFVTATDGIMARHCFVVNKEGECIDATLSHYDDNDYVSFKILEMSEYFDLLMEHNREPALYEAFLEEEQEAVLWALEQRIILIQ